MLLLAEALLQVVLLALQPEDLSVQVLGLGLKLGLVEAVDLQRLDALRQDGLALLQPCTRTS